MLFNLTKCHTAVIVSLDIFFDGLLMKMEFQNHILKCLIAYNRLFIDYIELNLAGLAYL